MSNYGLSREEMIEKQIAIPIKWDDDGSELYLTCTHSLHIEAVETEVDDEIDGFSQRVMVTDETQNIIQREGRMISMDYGDFVENLCGEGDND